MGQLNFIDRECVENNQPHGLSIAHRGSEILRPRSGSVLFAVQTSVTFRFQVCSCALAFWFCTSKDMLRSLRGLGLSFLLRRDSCFAGLTKCIWLWSSAPTTSQAGPLNSGLCSLHHESSGSVDRECVENNRTSRCIAPGRVCLLVLQECSTHDPLSFFLACPTPMSQVRTTLIHTMSAQKERPAMRSNGAQLRTALRSAMSSHDRCRAKAGSASIAALRRHCASLPPLGRHSRC